ncbi:MAG: hypothetical protein K2J74_06885 [Muribaculaceae bacterium]|nr:hypothetical protein [Muribaculaceae bacterium]
MNDTIIIIIIVAIYYLVMPYIARALERRITKRWVIFLLLFIIGILVTAIIGTITSVLIYLFTKP